MKKLVSISLILVICLAVLCSCSSRHASNEGYLLYRSSPIGVEIEYPDFWEIAEDKQNRTVAFATPNEGFADKYRDNVSVVCQQLEENEMAFDNYVTGYINQLPKSIEGYNKISEQEMTVGTCRAYRIVYEGTTTDGNLRLQHTFVESGKYVYVYTFIAEPASYDYFAKNSDIMLSTFKPLRK